MRSVVVATCVVACSYTPEGGITGDAPASDAPAAPDGMPDPDLQIEAELPTTTTSADGIHHWTVETDLAGFTGTGYVAALPNDSTNCNDIADTACGAFNTYDIRIVTTGMYRVIVRHHSTTTDADSIHWYLAGLEATEPLSPAAATWLDDTSTDLVMLTAGPATFGMRMRENNARVDHIRIELQR